MLSAEARVQSLRSRLATPAATPPQEITGVKVTSLHHDISTLTGEEVVLFTLAETPLFRDAKKK